MNEPSSSSAAPPPPPLDGATEDATTTDYAAAAAAVRVSLPLSGNNNNQKLTYKNHRYERGELRYNNQLEIYNNDQEKPK
jgi:hypothetical protein